MMGASGRETGGELGVRLRNLGRLYTSLSGERSSPNMYMVKMARPQPKRWQK